MSDLLQTLLRGRATCDAPQRRNDKRVEREGMSGNPQVAGIMLENLTSEVDDDGAVMFAKRAEYCEAVRSRRSGEEARFERRLASQAAEASVMSGECQRWRIPSELEAYLRFGFP